MECAVRARKKKNEISGMIFEICRKNKDML